ncbi:MAG: AraC family transcriptional regulator [Alphaproteobacteria bacterium]|nr:AraC family transcriptional regulator [Alphaproteobacteria bacterium]
MRGFGSAMTGMPHVAVSPPAIVQRQGIRWDLVQVEQMELIRHASFDYEFKGPRHLLIASERAERYDGETLIDGLPRSNRREWNRRMTFIPAGHRFYGWQKPRSLLRCTFIHVDPLSSLLCSELRFAELDFRPRLFFFDADVWATALKLKAQLQYPCRSQKAYVEALGIALAHELTRLNEAGSALASETRGGLPGWQQKKVAQYIGEHLANEISLLSLAQLVQLSPFHFSRAFKQSFGMPPHRYLTWQRIERAKALLGERKLSVTEIGLDVGFSETSSFTAAFRKLTGETPTAYRRSLA